jgi:hypothetical protein
MKSMLKRRILAEGGMMDESGEVVNGTEVPVGSLREEVADDVDAKLSVGEFVMPGDVVRYIGLEKLMKLRDKAKEGLQRMEEIGQVGNAQEVSNPDQAFSDAGIDMEDDGDLNAFESDIDSIINDVGRPDQDEQTRQAFAAGGDVLSETTFKGGSDLSKATGNPMVDVRYFKHDDGRTIFVTYINGKPMTKIPTGFTQMDKPTEQKVGKEADEKAEAKEAKANDFVGKDSGRGGNDFSGGDGSSSAGQGLNISADNVANAAFNNPRVTALALSAMFGIPYVLAKPLVSKLGDAYYTNKIDQMSQVFNDLTALSNVPGIRTTSDESGNVIGISSDAAINADDASIFGAISAGDRGLADVSNVANTGMGTLSDGTTISNDATIAAQNKALFGGGGGSTTSSNTSGVAGSTAATSSSPDGPDGNNAGQGFGGNTSGSRSGGGGFGSNAGSSPGGRSTGGGYGAGGWAKGGLVNKRAKKTK